MLYCPCRCSICTASLSLFVFLPCLLKIYLIILATPSKVQLRIGRKCALACLSFGSRRHRGTKENRRCLANTTRRIFGKYFRHWFAFWLFMSYLCTGKGSTQVFPFFVSVTASRWKRARTGYPSGLNELASWAKSAFKCARLTCSFGLRNIRKAGSLTFRDAQTTTLYFWGRKLCKAISISFKKTVNFSNHHRQDRNILPIGRKKGRNRL